MEEHSSTTVNIRDFVQPESGATDDLSSLDFDLTGIFRTSLRKRRDQNHLNMRKQILRMIRHESMFIFVDMNGNRLLEVLRTIGGFFIKSQTQSHPQSR